MFSLSSHLLRSMEAIIKAFPEQANAKDFKYGGTPVHWAENVEVGVLVFSFKLKERTVSILLNMY